MLPVLSVASECAPLIKTGGLADVAGALPGALADCDVEMRTLLPGFPSVLGALTKTVEVLRDPDLFGGPARVLQGTAAGLNLYVIEAPHLFDRPGNPYLDAEGLDWPDNPVRFAALSWVAARLAAEGAQGWAPQVVHAHDWQAGLAPLYIHTRGAEARIGTVMTIHNVAFIGAASANLLDNMRLPSSGFHPEGFEYYGQISALKAGLIWADRITTVSPTYARELMTPEFGMGLEGVLQARSAHVTGILNGIDETAWNPATDPAIAPYKTPRGKSAARAALIAEMGLDPEARGPLCVVVSRLSQQKGLDVLIDALPELLAQDGQLALLGSGDAALEAALTEAAAHPHVAVRLGYDEALSHRMIAGGDAILVPSRFEPCGLTQLYGLRYGTIPVVARTGGLADTVIDANQAARAAGVATGLHVPRVTVEAMAQAFRDLSALFADTKAWAQMKRRAMSHPVGWGPSAQAYAALYDQIANKAA